MTLRNRGISKMIHADATARRQVLKTIVSIMNLFTFFWTPNYLSVLSGAP
jgi:hypothetical protein